MHNLFSYDWVTLNLTRSTLFHWKKIKYMEIDEYAPQLSYTPRSDLP